MMEQLGFTEGTSLEDKRLNKGIERAQKKVEERNFSTRKHLLEWDEPMDFQRKEFYSARQRILEERDLPELIFDTIDNAIDTDAQAVPRRATTSEPASSEWCRTHLDLTIDEDSIDMPTSESRSGAASARRPRTRPTTDPHLPRRVHRPRGAAQRVGRRRAAPVGPAGVQGLHAHAEPAAQDGAAGDRRRPAARPPSLLRLRRSFDGVAMYLDPQYPYRALADWARTKFNIKVGAGGDCSIDPARRSRELLDSRVREAYRQREICLPRRVVPGTGLAGERHRQRRRGGSHRRLGQRQVQRRLEAGRRPRPHAAELHEILVKLNRGVLRRAARIRRSTQGIAGKTATTPIEWAKDRFGRAWN